ncbi:MAG: ATP-binding protein [Ruminococcus sp.]|nr:ATP-binding protein [Ruminococcus sp.]
MGIIAKIASKTANKIAEASQLSANQIEKIEKKKLEYLNEKPDMNSEENQELIKRLLGTLGVEVNHAYLSELNTIYTPIKTVPDKYAANDRIAYFDITKWVLDPEENYLDKLVNVYHVLSQDDCNIALIFHRTKFDCRITMAVVTNVEKDARSKALNFNKRLQEAVRGNFPGVVFENTNGAGIPPCLAEYKSPKNIASVTNVATEKSEKFISQSIEKLLDGVAPQNANQEYTFVLLASPSLDNEIKKNHLHDIYSALTPFASWQTNFTYTTSDNETSSFSGGVNLGTSAGVNSGSSVSKSITNAVTAGITGKLKIPFLGEVGANVSDTVATGKIDTQSKGVNANANFGVSFNRSSNVSINIGKNEGITQSFTNHQIKHTLELLDKQMKRLEQGAALGMWNFASYVISDDYNTANNVAHMYLALTQGEESFISQSAINTWHSTETDSETILREICHLHHPVFCLRDNLPEDWLMYPTTVDATTTISGRELAYSFNLPRKSVAGFPVIECAEFGRNIVTYDDTNDGNRKINLGKIFHMHNKENINVDLTIDSLTSHTFITGSTGAGKSNTVYKILDEANRNSVKFLVIEPAKGEYKHVFGNEKNVSVYGTNPKISSLLKLNPFSFPEGIHILEHLDRLVEIFNVCWPMYAAMPAVLKNAVEKAYEDCGWNLTASTNPYGNDMYPTFADVARNVRNIIDSSEYDAENKGAYKGSLLTRLQSLTNGINGMMFSVDEIPDKELFDENVIIDLSRVGSSETKSLLMGVIVLKLQEYRITSGKMNSSLNHLTVLEEAHNLLKRTSTEQPTEGGNLLGKSVEMIANSIAEMRTYGEGFIIADQAPGLLDMAAIRNTNTKIIMRLPDLLDRELVGRAANLNDNQIAELAKLPRGVAAVYQNEWIQPVLCCVDKYFSQNEFFKYEPGDEKSRKFDSAAAIEIAALLCNGTKLSRTDIMKNVLPYLRESGLTPSLQVTSINMLEFPVKNPKCTKIAPIIGTLFNEVKESVKRAYIESSSEKEWGVRANETLDIIINNTKISNELRTNIIQAVITDYIYNDLNKPDVLKKWIEKGVAK